MDEHNYTIRAYAFIIIEGNRILISDEFYANRQITKLPGGGLERGEGTLDCLKREAIEEFGQEIEVLEHIYTTDFYEPSFSFPGKQIIAIYYLAKFKSEIIFELKTKPFDFELINGSFAFRPIPLSEFNEEILTLRTDKAATNAFLKKLNNSEIKI